MEIGQKIEFSFGKGQMEGVVRKITGKTVYIAADFPKHKGKIVKRSVFDLEQKTKPKKKVKEKTKSKKAE